MRYRWPGNVRELRNFIERAVILSPHTLLQAPTAELEPFGAPGKSNLTMTGLDELERDHIIRALELSNWVVGGRNGAAQRLGMKRTSLVYKMQKHRIARPASSREASAVDGRASRSLGLAFPPRQYLLSALFHPAVIEGIGCQCASRLLH